MRLLAIDIGSSSVKAAVLTGERAPIRHAHVRFPTRFDDDGVAPRAEVDVAAIDRALRKAIDELGPGARRADLIAPTTMAPSWLAMGAAGKPLTPIITHQDRRSISEAAEIERRVGKAAHLKLAGNRPFPGGISSTTWAWHLTHARPVMKRAELVGHLGTWLIRTLTGERIIDVSNAGFTGLMDVRTFDWSDRLIEAVGIDRSHLPTIVQSDAVVGTITARAAQRFGITEGTPLLAGCIDGSAAMLAAGAKVGQLVNVCGSTDVLALCVEKPRPHESLLTRPLGVDGKWLSVSTIAAAGSAMEWVRRTLFSEMERPVFYRHLMRIGQHGNASAGVRFANHLAGSRTSMTLERAAIECLTLSSTRDDALFALISALRAESGRRIERFKEIGLPMRAGVFSTGGGSSIAAKVLRTSWPKRFTFREKDEATLRGVWTLAARVAKTN